MTRVTTPLLVACCLLFGLALLPAFAVPSTAADANDALNGATRIERLPYTDSADTADATSDGSDPTPTCGDPTAGVGHTVWHKLKRRKETSVEANTFDSDYDTVLAVYARSGTRENPTFTEVACNDDQFPIGQSQVSFTAQRRTTYYIEVGAYGVKDAGHLELSVGKQTS
jgi:hypothetical protein